MSIFKMNDNKPIDVDVHQSMQCSCEYEDLRGMIGSYIYRNYPHLPEEEWIVSIGKELVYFYHRDERITHFIEGSLDEIEFGQCSTPRCGIDDSVLILGNEDVKPSYNDLEGFYVTLGGAPDLNITWEMLEINAMVLAEVSEKDIDVVQGINTSLRIKVDDMEFNDLYHVFDIVNLRVCHSLSKGSIVLVNNDQVVAVVPSYLSERVSFISFVDGTVIVVDYGRSQTWTLTW